MIIKVFLCWPLNVGILNSRTTVPGPVRLPSLSLCPAGPINTKANDSGFVGQTEQKGGRANDAMRSSLHHNGTRNFDMAATFSTLNV